MNTVLNMARTLYGYGRPARSRPKLRTTRQRGYTGRHRSLREARLAAYRPGQICVMGGEPMTWWPLEVARQYIDLPHDHVNGGYLPGLACRKHNRGEPQRRRARKTTIPATFRTSRDW